MELEKVRVDPVQVIPEIMVAHRKAPKDREVVEMFSSCYRSQVALIKEVAGPDVAVCGFAEQFGQTIWRQPLSRTGDAKLVLGEHFAGLDRPRGGNAFCQGFAIEQFPLAYVASRPLPG